MWSTDFHLCPEGERLYLIWAGLDDAHAPTQERYAARDVYYQHRRDCPNCSDPWRKEPEGENEMQSG